MSKSPILFSSDDEDDDSHQESEVLKKFQIMLQGVPPPSSVTMSKLTVSDMLSKYQENENSFGIFGSHSINVSQKSFAKMNSTPLVYYLNSSQTSEEIATISQKVQSRYIYSETLSSCNIWFDSAVKINSARKKSGRRSGFGLSPGSRLSHLARRRQIFSCENLQQLANSEKRRHIEIKKQDALKNRILERNKTVNNEKNNSFKRALFLSPDDDGKKKKTTEMIKRNLFPSSGKEKTNISKTVGSSAYSAQNCYNEGSSKKRKRTESRDGSGTWPRRALTFTEDEPDQSHEKRNAKVMKEIELSMHHKSKLLWAVATTLKEKNMCSKDPQFKTCAAALFMICRKNLGKIINSNMEGGTSEKMLHFARQHIGGIFEKLGISNESNSNSVLKNVNQDNDQKLNAQNDACSTSDTKKDFEGCELVCSNETEIIVNKAETVPSEVCQNHNLDTCINEKENIVLPENNDRVS